MSLLFILLVALAAFTALATRALEARFPATGVYVDADGTRVHMLDRPAHGRALGAVLLIHGASGNAHDLDAALGARLSEAGLRVLSADRPGHGWSERLAGADAASPVAQGRALVRAARALGVESAIVAVHSLGGITGLAMALDAPDFVRALVLIAPVSHPWPGGVSWYYAVGAHPLFGPPFRRLVTLPAGLAYLRAAVKGVFAPNPVPPGFIAATRLPLVLRPVHFRANCEDVAEAKAATLALSPSYGSIRTPVEVVAGEGDTVVANSLHADGIARDVAGAQLTVLEGVGHSPHHAAPERVVAAILEAERRAREIHHKDTKGTKEGTKSL